MIIKKSGLIEDERA